MNDLWVILFVSDVCGQCCSAVTAVAVDDDNDDMRTKECLARSPLVTSQQSVELKGSYRNVDSLKVPIAEAEAETESDSESDSDHQSDEGTSDEEKKIEVSDFFFLLQPTQTWLTDFKVWIWKKLSQVKDSEEYRMPFFLSHVRKICVTTAAHKVQREE